MTRNSRLLVCAALALVTVAPTLPGATASAAVREPGRVGLVSVVGATTTSLTLRWPEVAGATRYLVDMASNPADTDRRPVTEVDTNTARVSGLMPGQIYCFQVRAQNSGGTGLRSAHSCKPTIVAQGTTAGPVYRLLTYNLCTKACPDWAERRRPALRLIKDASPDVIGLQENTSTSKVRRKLRTTFRTAEDHAALTLLYRRSRFRLVRSGTIDLGPGSTDKPRWAVWAELADRAFPGRRLLVADGHVARGPDTVAADAVRERNTRRMVAGVERRNVNHVPVVYLGDFNSHRHRDHDSPARVFGDAGFVDSYDLAQRLTRPNLNSANGGRRTPRIGVTWGDHVDHFWVDPDASRVLNWINAARVVGGLYPAPLPSNHNPILARVQVN